MSKELEFISVENDDDEEFGMDQTYAEQPSSAYEHALGNTFLRQSKHPCALLFHVLFKSLAIFLYMFGGWFTSNFILVFVLCIILLAFDFWTVKNITGRLLVGLRWWSYVREDGTNEWIFESLEDMAEVSNFDSRIFWGALYVTPIVWALLLVLGILRLKIEYLPIVIAALMLSSANIMGYIKCSNSAQAKVRNIVENGFKQGSMAALENSSFRNWILSTLVATTQPTQSSRREPARTATV
mmetsp:Transcript_4836/g.7364  ORF Transcript_4836/g.7364 Transcript_4836/m.7364 type:complete len:241 (+) Transcript_4836:33-755(+)